MTKTVEAIFDGQVLRLKEPLDLEPNTVVQVTINTVEDTERKPYLFFRSGALSETRGSARLVGEVRGLSLRTLPR